MFPFSLKACRFYVFGVQRVLLNFEVCCGGVIVSRPIFWGSSVCGCSFSCFNVFGVQHSIFGVSGSGSSFPFSIERGFGSRKPRCGNGAFGLRVSGFSYLNLKDPC